MMTEPSVEKVEIQKQSTIDEEDDKVFPLMPLKECKGWNAKLDNLMSSNEVKMSVVEGKEPKADYSHIKLNMLDAMASDMVDSVMPD